MLVDEPNLSGRRIAQGVYEVDRLEPLDLLGEPYKPYPDVGDSINPFGVCDGYEQVIEQCPGLRLDPNRQFILVVTPVLKSSQPPTGGWSWHRYGMYIGTQKPLREYLYDEPLIEKVYCYFIFERT